MFFFIGGIQPRTVLIEEQSRPCPFCAHTDVQLQRTDHYISIFFIPIFRVKKGVPFLRCSHCRSLISDDWAEVKNRDAKKRKICFFCKEFVEDKFSFCPYCGRPL